MNHQSPLFRSSFGFTLIEVLVSLAVIMMLVGAATASFFQLSTMSKRIQARQALCNNAQLVNNRLRWEADAMINAGAWWLRSTNDTVELIFLRGKLDRTDFDITNSDPAALTDLVWTRVYWNKTSENLTIASSSPRRAFILGSDWNGTTGSDKIPKGSYIHQLPQTVRQAGTDPQQVLDTNSLGTSDPNDIGDYGDLVANAVPIATNCTDLAIQAELVDGTSSTVGSANIHADGVTIDGRGTAWLKRPRMLRIRFTLRAPGFRIDQSTGQPDPTTVIEQTFSFSFSTPSFKR